jgi:hypothetical protein
LRQLERARQKCDVYRANLLSVLKDIEEQKLQLSVKVQNIKLATKDWDLNGIDVIQMRVATSVRSRFAVDWHMKKQGGEGGWHSFTFT